MNQSYVKVDRGRVFLRLLLAMKKVFEWAHRWFGLIAGFYFVLLGLSGSYLVYDEAIDRFLKPELWRSSGHQTPLASWDQLVRAAQTGLQSEKPPFMIRISGDETQNARVSLDVAKQGEERKIAVAFLDPSSAEMRGSEVSKETVTGFIFAFHHDLFWGGTGRIIMAVSGLLMCFILLSGLYLWWPRGRSFTSALKTRKWRNALQMNLELHKVTGLYTLILMIVVTATGTYISKPDWFGAGSRPRAERPAQEKKSAPSTFDWLAIQASMEGEFGPALRPLFIRVNAKAGTAAVLAWPGGQEVRRVFNSDGTLKPEEKAESRTQDLRAINHDLHVGHFWGEFGNLLIFVSGILPLFFYVTGFIVWRKKANLKNQKHPRTQGTRTEP